MLKLCHKNISKKVTHFDTPGSSFSELKMTNFILRIIDGWIIGYKLINLINCIHNWRSPGLTHLGSEASN